MKYSATLRIRFLLPVLLFKSLNLFAQPQIAPFAYSSPSIVNYIRTWTAKAPQTDASIISVTASTDSFLMTTQYIDGLGRPVQTVAKGMSPLGNDYVVPMVYDQFSRQQFQYLSFVADSTCNASINDGLFKLSPFQQDSSFYDNANANSPIKGQGETFFYSQTVFEPSPLNRVTNAYTPGNSWVGASRGTALQYLINTASDSVRIWIAGANASDIPTTSTTYNTGELYKNISVDENSKQVVEYKDKEGRVVLKKVQLSATPGTAHVGWLCTYYVYDDLGNLRFVLPPKAVEALLAANWQLSAVIRDELCFYYGYDARNRMTIKKVPGAGEVDMVYDARDRLVMTQDANLRAAQKWTYIQYDALNRPVASGLLTDPANYNNPSYHWTNASTSTSYPVLSNYTYENLTITHYDDYAGLPSGLYSTLQGSYNSYFITTYNSSPDYAQQLIASSQTKGMVTWTQTKLLGTTNQYLPSVNIYDDKARLIQTQSINITGGVDIASTQFDFSGKVLRSHVQHQKLGGVVQNYTVATKNNYDDLGRIVSVEKNINNAGWKMISSLQYDALGELKTKILSPSFGGGAGLETLTYDYNIRGWLLGENRWFVQDGTPPPGGAGGGYFGFDLGYDKNGVIGTYTPQYNGNIAGTVWKSKGDGAKRKYDFSYDAANRLTGADFNQWVSGSGSAAAFDKSAGIDYSVSNLSYDANGNILTQNQKGWKVGGSSFIDQLSYSYTANSNKLLAVSDASNDNTSRLGDFKYDPATKTATDYNYDVNGNLTLDNNKKISSIVYNYLNLPQTITVTGKGTISYVYDAAGNKLQKITVDNTVSPAKTTVTTYIGGFVYEASSPVGGGQVGADVLQFISHEEGRIRPLRDANNNLTGFTYDYFLKDHLGNVRMVLTEEAKTDAYPAATMETATINSESTYYGNLTNTQWAKPSWFSDPLYSSSSQVARVKNSSTTQKVGPGILLKVMAGDSYNIRVASGWNDAGTPNNSSSEILTDLFNALTNNLAAISGGKATATQLQNSSSGLNTGLTNFLSTQTNSGSAPKAYINWILLDEQFKYYDGGFEQVGASGATTIHLKNGLTVGKNGFLYVYTSNEATNIDVFFDNLQVTHIRGPLLEETHYYPFGLAMAGISSKAAGGVENKKSKFQGQEFTNDFDISAYEFKWRTHDPQIGRFWQIDPLADKYRYNSTYAFSENKVTSHVELEGLEAISITKEDGTSGVMYGPYANQASAQRAYNETYTKQGGRLFVDNAGFAQSPRISTNRVSKLERGAFKSSIQGIVLHRTVSRTASSTISAFKTGRDGVNYGTHFVVDKDGTVMQTASLQFYTLHVGKTRKDEYPNNKNSIGIEVVGMYDEESETWEDMTQAQTDATAWLTNSLLKTYNLTRTNVYKHEQISYKTAGEGKVVYDAIIQFLISTVNNNNNSINTNAGSGDGRVLPRFY